MNPKTKKHYLWGGALAVLFLAGCGGGSEGPQPLGLFDKETQQNQNTAVPKTNPAQVLSVSDVAMGANFSEGGEASKGLAFSPSFGLQSFLSKVGKTTEINLATHCRLVDEMTEECTASAAGPISGNINALMSSHITEATETRLAGVFDLVINFNGFTFNEDSCGQQISTSGTFGCRLDVIAELVNNNQDIDFRFSGLCNTAKDSDHLMDVVLGDSAHQVGYDLALDFQVNIPLGEARMVYLNESNITGTISVDGVNYAYADLRAVLGNLTCGQ